MRRHRLTVRQTDRWSELRARDPISPMKIRIKLVNKASTHSYYFAMENARTHLIKVDFITWLILIKHVNVFSYTNW